MKAYGNGVLVVYDTLIEAVLDNKMDPYEMSKTAVLLYPYASDLLDEEATEAIRDFKIGCEDFPFEGKLDAPFEDLCKETLRKIRPLWVKVNSA